MHAVFLTFEFAGEYGDLTRTFAAFTEALPSERDLVSRTWMRDGSTIGGFYVFHTVEAAEEFLNSPHIRALASHPCISDLYVRHFSTLGTIGAALPASPESLRTPVGTEGEACAIWQADQAYVSAHTG